MVAVAEVLREIDQASLLALAERMVAPEDELRWRLFHLAVLGQLLLALRDLEARILSFGRLHGARLRSQGSQVRIPPCFAWRERWRRGVLVEQC